MINLALGFSTILLCAVTGAVVPAGVTVTNLSCESLTNPLGMDVATPRLGWILQSGVRGEKQNAFQVLVASTQDLLAGDRGDLWDSGKVDSGQSIQVPYAGAPLTSFQTCFWKVRVWNKDNIPGPWSAPALWTMGVLQQEDWANAQWIGLSAGETAHPLSEAIKQARWIWFPEANPESAGKPGTVYVRKSFVLPEAAEEAVLLVAADNPALGRMCGEIVAQTLGGI